MYEYYRIGDMDRKTKRTIMSIWRSGTDYWYSLAVDRIKSFFDTSFRLLVVRGKGIDALEITTRVLERELGYSVKVYDAFDPEQFLTGFKNLSKHVVPLISIHGAKIVLYSTRDELKQIVSGKKKVLDAESLGGDIVDLFSEGVLETKKSMIPLYRWDRKVIVVDTDVESEPHETLYVALYPWRPYSLYEELVDRGITEEDAEKITRITSGDISYLIKQTRYGGYIISKNTETLYMMLYRIEHGDYSITWKIPRHIIVRILLGMNTWTEFGRPVDLYAPRECGTDYLEGRNVIGVGTDIDCLHERTGYKYRFIISGKQRYKCNECPFRNVCPYLYFHPGKCSFK